MAVALELFDETFAVRPARAPYDPGGGVETYEFVGSFSREGGVEGSRVSVEKETHENQTHESETLVTQVNGEDLDAALARTVRLFIFAASKPDESYQAKAD